MHVSLHTDNSPSATCNCLQGPNNQIHWGPIVHANCTPSLVSPVTFRLEDLAKVSAIYLRCNSNNYQNYNTCALSIGVVRMYTPRLTGASVAVLPICLSNFRAIRYFIILSQGFAV